MIEMESSTDPREHKWKSYCEKASEGEHVNQESETSSPFQIGAASALIVCGVILPVFAITFGTIYSFEGIWRLTILHPLETLLESALICSVPFSNFMAWHAYCKNDLRRPIRTGILNGIAIAVPALTLSISVAALALNYPLIDTVNQTRHDLSIGLMGLVSLCSMLSAMYITHKLRQAKQTRDAKWRTILYSMLGIGLTLVSFLGAEARSTYIRVAQNLALSDDNTEREHGLKMLRESGPEKELKIICADPHAAGLAGMFLPLNTDAQRRLFFAGTGKPYRDEKSTDISLMSNDYLRNHVVGTAVEGLSLHRSAIFGVVHPETLTSSLTWTFVFKNKTYVNQEARAEISIPEGAVLSGLTLWINGKPRPAVFSSTDATVMSSVNFVSQQDKTPALVTDLGRGRYLLSASPIPGQQELKVQVKLTQPLKLDGANHAALGMPRFIDENFALQGQHSLTLRSTAKLTSELQSIKTTQTADGAQILSGTLSQEDISKTAFSVKLDKPITFANVAMLDPYNRNMRFLVEQLKTRSVKAPKHLTVVVDSSAAMENRKNEVVEALSKMPAQIDARLMIAGDKENESTYTLDEGIKKLKSNNFTGGQDNLFALVKAAEKAGESSGGAILWIHGPQPGFNNEMYTMSPYASAPAFFEIALDDCLTNTNEFFKNHSEIGPFEAVSRSGSLKDDLKSFLSKWEPGAAETYIDVVAESTPPSQINVLTDAAIASEVATLNAAKRIKYLLAQNKNMEAAEQAIRYQIVSPISAAMVLNNAADYGRIGLALNGQDSPKAKPTQTQTDEVASTDAFQNAAPSLQGATSGTVLNNDNTVIISGVNTAGTVRVNNLANLEALLNIGSNLTEIFGLALGTVNVVFGFMNRAVVFPFRMSPRLRIAFGIAIGVAAVTVPGCMNWLVSSARDANLFS